MFMANKAIKEYRAIFDSFDPSHLGEIAFKEFVDTLRVTAFANNALVD
jgi:Ca2+-binding EF-hand superfamily protein